jgi:hypothetical protein
MNTLILCFALLILFGACKKETEDSVPDCIRNNIERYKDNPNWFIKSIDEYQYQGMTVYIFNPVPNYADAQTAIVKPDCTNACFLGGITGNRMCNGESFTEKAVFVRTIWQK